MWGTWPRRHPDAAARYPVTFSLDFFSCRVALLHPSVSSPVSALTHLRGQGGNRGNRMPEPTWNIFQKPFSFNLFVLNLLFRAQYEILRKKGVFTKNSLSLWLSASGSGATAPVFVARPDEFPVTSHYSNIETCMDRPSSVGRAIRGGE